MLPLCGLLAVLAQRLLRPYRQHPRWSGWSGAVDALQSLVHPIHHTAAPARGILAWVERRHMGCLCGSKPPSNDSLFNAGVPVGRS